MEPDRQLSDGTIFLKSGADTAAGSSQQSERGRSLIASVTPCKYFVPGQTATFLLACAHSTEPWLSVCSLWMRPNRGLWHHMKHN